MIRKIIHIAGVSLVLVALGMLLSFSVSNNMQTVCTHFEIKVRSQSGNYFMHAGDFRTLIVKDLDTIEGRHISPEKLQTVHTLIHSMPFVKHANIYRTINNELRADIRLRDPLMRVINRHNQSYYVDTQGYMFPLSGTHTARVMIVSGHVGAVYEAGKNIRNLDEDKDQKHRDTMNDLFLLASYIHHDPFWRALIDHIAILENGKFEMIPKNGVHIIEFGYADNIVDKFNKLRFFYVNGLPEIGWHYYNRINLEFNQQVICSK